jgi:acetyl esterase/lipase
MTPVVDLSSTPYELDVREVEYLRRGDEALLARIYSPRGGGPYPLLVEVHGGIWTSGSRLSNEPIARAIAETGVVVVSLDFRQPPVAGYPVSLQDISQGIRWVSGHAEELNGDPGALGAIGTSTGGHQVLLLALQPWNERYADPDPAEPDGRGVELDFLALCWPITDPWARYEWARHHGKTKFVERHDLYWGGTEPMRQANPQLILDRGERIRRPPLLIVQGSADQNVPYTIPEKFVRSYRAIGGQARFELFEGQPHGFVKRGMGSAEAVRALALICDFVAEQTEITATHI